MDCSRVKLLILFLKYFKKTVYMKVTSSDMDGSENSETESEKGFRGDSLLKFVMPFTMSIIGKGSLLATIFLFFLSFFLFRIFHKNSADAWDKNVDCFLRDNKLTPLLFYRHE